jgi:hypothetical protein
MSWGDIATIAGGVALVALVFIGFRGVTRVPPSGRDHSDDHGASSLGGSRDGPTHH